VTIRGAAARAVAGLKRFLFAPAWSDRHRTRDAYKARGQFEAERLDMHRHSGRFGGHGT
jgi:hypothetical protein